MGEALDQLTNAEGKLDTVDHAQTIQTEPKVLETYSPTQDGYSSLKWTRIGYETKRKFNGVILSPNYLLSYCQEHIYRWSISASITLILSTSQVGTIQ